ncbi:MAG: hypothetical protein JKY42_12165 [Flavobacteriales bacterium]|nr:hypothetical protein [Flavobacteriales bacterium]
MSKKKNNEKENSSLELIKRETYLKQIKKEVNDYVNNIDFEKTDYTIDSILRRSLLEQKVKKDPSPFSSVPIRVFDVIESIIKYYTEDLFENIEDLKAKEEDITASLSIKMTDYLVGKMKSKFDGKTIGGYKFKIKTQKKQKQEAFTGADLVGVCTIDQGEIVINKYFLLQAKVGIRRDDGSSYAIDSRIQVQAKKMLKISPASFFIIYTNKGFDIVSAMNVLATGKNEIDSRIIQAKPYEEFNNLLLDCFSGDNRFEKKEWQDYISDPKKNPIPYEEALLHLFVKKGKKT